MTAAPHSRARVPSPTAAAGGPVSNAMVRVTRLHILRVRQLFRELGLHPGQELLLMHLWDTGPQRQSDLAAVFDTDSASMSRTVQRMERAGFVRRRRDPSDGRAGLVESTEAGLALRGQVEQLWTDLETATTGDMPPAEREALLRSLAHLERNLVAVQNAECDARPPAADAGA
ncbi:MarR family winged helix-turn-helix transcriptional regulator [Streptomyces sp. V4-01]|uniref:MarR family winged helix-turn-helix transcriptional regulator n=1 Tax=Actinacidiphila polyblastidii TaxID=3110430 RepID=A0ABU7PIS1_9ACTN|nr:MarR family winged helix-turn-helix transcriptional regulator [Streptomyces sp. V4-01]